MADIMKVEHNVRVLQEAKSLQNSGHEVKILGFSNVTKQRKFKVNDIDVVSFYLHDGRSGFGKIYRFYTAIKMLTGISLCILFSKADIYHAHNFHVLPACFLSAFIHKGKLIYDTHESWTIQKNKKCHPQHVFAFIIEKLLLRFIDSFITVNEMIVDFYNTKYHIKEATILYNTRAKTPITQKNLISEELNTDEDKKIAIFVGGFWPTGRGIFELIRSAQYLDEDVIVVLMGYGSDDMLKRMNDEIKRIKGENRVIVLPPQPPEKVLDYIMSADIGMNLIKRENKAQDFQSPWKLFEYCMAGLAVISNDLPFQKKIHKKYNIGPIIGKDNDPQEIAQKINELIHDKKELSRCKINSRLAAVREFNWEKQEPKLLKIYRSLEN